RSSSPRHSCPKCARLNKKTWKGNAELRPNKTHLTHVLSLGFILTLCASAQPYAYVANAGANRVSVVDCSSNAVVGSIELPSAPVGIDVSPDGSKVYIAHGDSLAIADSTTRRLLA